MAMSQNSTSSSLPQGFSVFQPALGAQLQFFPAVGTQELDDLMHSFIPGPATIQEKRTSVALDFLEFSQLTGETFKFYPVYSVNSYVESPVSDSVSSFNASPATSSWDWQPSGAASVSSRSSKKASKPSSGSSPTNQGSDFSHLPGMKIMTKDGRDVTNSASRGSKTKEQRDHAHLMRIIKACEACRKKKIRCDPSHKRRVASQPSASPAQKVVKKTKAAAPSQQQQQQPSVSPPTFGNDFLAQTPFGLEPSFSFADLQTSELTMPFDAMDEFLDQSAFIPNDLDFILDPQGYLSGDASFSTTTSSSASPSKFLSPLEESPTMGASDIFSTDVQSQSKIQPQSPSAPFTDTGCASSIPFTDTGCTLQLPFTDTGCDSADMYEDFNLYSPASDFSEDEHMVSIEESSERFSTKSQSQSPVEVSESPRGASQSPRGQASMIESSVHPSSWYGDVGLAEMVEWPGIIPADDVPPADGQAYYDAECCIPLPEPWRLPQPDSAIRSGVGNSDLIRAYEPETASHGVVRSTAVQPETHSPTTSDRIVRSHAVQSETRSSTIFSGLFSNSSETAMAPGGSSVSIDAVQRLRGIEYAGLSPLDAYQILHGSIQPFTSTGSSAQQDGDSAQQDTLAASASSSSSAVVASVPSSSVYGVGENNSASPAVSFGSSSVVLQTSSSCVSSSGTPPPFVDGQESEQDQTTLYERIVAASRGPVVGSTAPLSSPLVVLALVVLVWAMFNKASLVAMIMYALPLALRNVKQSSKGIFSAIQVDREESCASTPHVAGTVQACRTVSASHRSASSGLQSSMHLGRLLSF